MSSTDTSSAVPNESEDRKKVFSCCICLDTPSDPVLTPCGHLFCWSCLVNWLDGNHDDCPVCRGHVTRENVTPIYGADGETKDPRKSQNMPKRPQAHYEESEHSRQNRNQNNFFNMFGGMPPGFMNFNINGGTFMVGGGSPLFMIIHIIMMVFRIVTNWWNNRRNSSSTSDSSSHSEERSETGTNNDVVYIVVTVVALLLVSFFF